MTYGIKLISHKGTVAVTDQYPSYQLLFSGVTGSSMWFYSEAPLLVFSPPQGYYGGSYVVPAGHGVYRGDYSWDPNSPYTGWQNVIGSTTAPAYVFGVPSNVTPSGFGISVRGASKFTIDSNRWPLVVEDQVDIRAGIWSPGQNEAFIPYNAAFFSLFNTGTPIASGTLFNQPGGIRITRDGQFVILNGWTAVANYVGGGIQLTSLAVWATDTTPRDNYARILTINIGKYPSSFVF